MFYKFFTDPLEQDWLKQAIADISVQKTMDLERELEGTAWCSKERVILAMGQRYYPKRVSDIDRKIIAENYRTTKIPRKRGGTHDSFWVATKCVLADITDKMMYVEGFRAIDGVLEYRAWNSFNGCIVDHTTVYNPNSDDEHVNRFTVGSIRDGIEYFGAELDNQLITGEPVLALYDTCFGWPIQNQRPQL